MDSVEGDSGRKYLDSYFQHYQTLIKLNERAKLEQWLRSG